MISSVRTGAGHVVVVQGQEAADVDQGVLLGAHGAAVGVAEELARDLLDAPVLLPGLAPLDEPGVLGEAGAVQEERHAVRACSSRDTSRTLARLTGWPPPLLLVMVSMTKGIRSPYLANAASSLADRDVALERRLDQGVEPLVAHAVQRHGAAELHVGAGGVEVDVVGHHVLLLHEDAEEQVLRRASLMAGDDVLVAGDAPDGGLEVGPAAALRVGLVAGHHGRPLPVAHGRRAAVGEQVDVDGDRTGS